MSDPLEVQNGARTSSYQKRKLRILPSSLSLDEDLDDSLFQVRSFHYGKP